MDTHHGLFATGILEVLSNKYPYSETMMRFYDQQHRFYGGVDLHARTLSLHILDRVSSSKVGGISVHKSTRGRLAEKSTDTLREPAMQEALSPAQEAQAQQLAQAISRAAQDELLQVARLLVVSSDATLFGPTEFKVRDLILRVAAKAYQEHLGQKKTATRAPA
jgi:hypothetical protein